MLVNVLFSVRDGKIHGSVTISYTFGSRRGGITPTCIQHKQNNTVLEKAEKIKVMQWVCKQVASREGGKTSTSIQHSKTSEVVVLYNFLCSVRGGKTQRKIILINSP